ncbi:Gfo/Idh/MocA family protein [Embleya scabrispora]|uniref:Gfo/Idh/MocA family protein n=1 Tax=Embleya scabrispora TaxID=159449 RepID=UPI0003735044|nr:Gfo/Idh/MocA family oxidoreductase [Embleya scabrispora]MYS82070.1 Gfo/Idh/MocA family oxidoreductase [Streptomyces sp. SID5474]
MGEPLRVGVVGAGNISGAYLSTLAALPDLRVVAVTDHDRRRALAAAATTPGSRSVALDELLADEEIDVVLNLTTPGAHAEVALAALAAGKHVYGEKPLAANPADAAAVVAAANKAGLRVGCAPDTVLGVGVQTARRTIEDGLIGMPTSATATMVGFGHERWHPDPEFYYLPGGGPLLDMGPYYLSALVHLLGPVKSVTGIGSRPRPLRTIATGPRAGTTFQTSVDTHVTGILEHENGVLTSLIMSFDVAASRASHIEVHGSAGSLMVPDPNRFDGDCEVSIPAEVGWHVLPPSAGYVGARRGIGLAEMAQAIRDSRPHRASADLARHVLDCSYTLLDAADRRTTLDVRSRCEVPPLVPLDDHGFGQTPKCRPA